MSSNSIKIMKFIMYILFLIATTLGLFSQNIAYFLHENISNINLLSSLSILISIIMVLYLIILTIGIFYYKFTENKMRKGNLFHIIMLIIGIFTIIWNIFVLVMWNS